MSPRLLALALPALAFSQPARAELPAPVRAIIDAAIATGDAAKVATVIDLARQTNPEDAEEIAQLHDAFLTHQRELAAEAERQALIARREAGLFENWGGRGEIGAFHATGNSRDTGLTAALALERTGIDWEHRLRARADYQRSNGRTSREQYSLAYEPRYGVSPRLFAYALAQAERDPIQGYASRLSASGGIGYQAIDGEALDLSIKAGPAWRRTNLAGGGGQSNIGALAGLDFDWRILPQLTLTQNTDLVAETGGSAVAIIDSANTSLTLVTGLEAKVSQTLTTRLAYTVDYNSNPPPGAVATDTHTRFSLVYDF